MTQIVFMLYEDVAKNKGEEGKFKVDVRFSPGVKAHLDPLDEDFGSSGSELFDNSPDIPKLSTFVKRLSADVQQTDPRGRRISAPSVIKRVSALSSQRKEPLIPLSKSDSHSTFSCTALSVSKIRKGLMPSSYKRDTVFPSTAGKGSFNMNFNVLCLYVIFIYIPADYDPV